MSVKRLVETWGTVVVIEATSSGLDEVAVSAAVDEVEKFFYQVDRGFSTYKSDSQVSRIRRGELSIEDAKGLLSESVAHINDRLTIVCANEGRLRAVTESPTSSEYKHLVRLHDVLIRSLESHDSEIDEIQVFNLNLQKITAHPDTEQWIKISRCFLRNR